jgi:hypothetical protein
LKLQEEKSNKIKTEHRRTTREVRGLKRIIGSAKERRRADGIVAGTVTKNVSK